MAPILYMSLYISCHLRLEETISDKGQCLFNTVRPYGVYADASMEISIIYCSLPRLLEYGT